MATVSFEYTNLYDFRQSVYIESPNTLIKSSNGLFYGSSTNGGINNAGTIFSMNSSGVITKIFDFDYNNISGGNPRVNLIDNSQRLLYGTTENGGINYGYGVLFCIDLSGGNFQVLHEFSYNDGRFGTNNLLKASNGLIYGTIKQGGINDTGTVYSFDLSTNTFSVLHNFDSNTGWFPYAGLIEYNNILYGTTYYGGLYGNGTIYSIDMSSNTYNSLYSFNTNDGIDNTAELVVYNGLLYGVCNRGGLNSYGTLFSFDLSSTILSVLHNFDHIEGSAPNSPLVIGSDGIFYSVTNTSQNGNGILYSFDVSNNIYTLIHDFTGGINDGSYPRCQLIQDGNLLYGTTPQGGINSIGTIFTYNINNNTYNVLQNSLYTFTDGRNPVYELLQASNGLLYGVTRNGGQGNEGTVYYIDLSGNNYTIIHHFNSTIPSDGRNPYCSLIQVSNLIYGTTQYGGTYDEGIIFSMDLSGNNYTILHNLNIEANGDNGDQGPQGGVIQATNGLLYGTTRYGGENNDGTIYSIDCSGINFTLIHSFNNNNYYGDNQDGANPICELIQARNGLLYGTTRNGGNNGDGIIFSLNPIDNSYNIIKVFERGDYGDTPLSGLTQGTTDVLYGTTRYSARDGGEHGGGVIYSIDFSGNNYTVLKSINNDENEGYDPETKLLLDNGTLYGTTNEGGDNDYGVIFAYVLNSGSFYVLHHFDYETGGYPLGGLIKGSNSLFYGTTNSNGLDENGVIYSLSVPPPINNICFPGNTPVLTDQGIFPISSLDPLKHTINKQKIVAITKTFSNDKYLICFERHALEPNVPNKQTVISRNHKVLYKGQLIEAYKLLEKIGITEIGIPVKKVKYDGQALYNVLLENYGVMKVNNMTVETLHPENEIARLYNGKKPLDRKDLTVRKKCLLGHKKSR